MCSGPNGSGARWKYFVNSSRMNVQVFCSILGVVSPLEFVQHEFSQMGHWDLLSL
jgi:hypothetical protein